MKHTTTGNGKKTELQADHQTIAESNVQTYIVSVHWYEPNSGSCHLTIIHAAPSKMPKARSCLMTAADFTFYYITNIIHTLFMNI